MGCAYMASLKNPGPPGNVFVHHLQHNLLHKRQHQRKRCQPDCCHAHSKRLLRKAGRLVRQLLPKDYLQDLPNAATCPQSFNTLPDSWRFSSDELIDKLIFEAFHNLFSGFGLHRGPSVESKQHTYDVHAWMLPSGEFMNSRRESARAVEAHWSLPGRC